ncbi:MAG: beta-propeller domain-containing protein [Eubacterium sp.]
MKKNKNNDLNFISAKLNNSGVNAPEDINKEFVLNKISNKKAEKIKMPVKKRITIAASSFVACIAIFVVVAVAATNPSVNNMPLTAENGQIIRSFTSYDEIQSTIKQINKSNRNGMYEFSDTLGFSKSAYDTATVSESSAASNAAGSGNYAQTYKQVDAVDEADIIKTDGKYIYYVNYDCVVRIYNTDKKNPKQVAQVKNGDRWIDDIFLSDNRLITISNDTDSDYNSITSVSIYDVSDIKNIKKLSSFSQSGNYSSSRMIGDMLYLVSNQYIYDDDCLPYVCKNDSESKCIAAGDVYCVANPIDESFLVISQIDTSDMKQDTQTKAILGAADNVYCNEKNMYITATDYNWHDENTKATTQIIKASLENGIKFTATAKVNGYINDQYSLDEYEGMLRVATTSYNKKGNEINNLYVLDSDLNKTGSVTGFAKDESIKAVKYVGNTAYVITYEETDPLFVIDLADETKPKILGEVKIDGFSSMLVPVGDDKLLGIGYYTTDNDEINMQVTDGVKLVLFDISDKTKPAVLDEKVYKSSYSEVQSNPKALVFNSERNNFTIPINYYGDSTYSRCGIVTFSVDDDEISIDGNYETNKFTSCDRCTYVDDTIYILSSEGEIDCIQYK